MAACDELESIILDRAAGALGPDEAAALDAHLGGCPRCRAWLSSCEEAIRLASLPAPSEVELRLFAQLPGRARSAFRQRSRRSSWGRLLVGLTLAAAAAMAVLVVGAPRWKARDGGAARPVAMASMVEDDSELVAWALADPLEDPGGALDADGEDDESGDSAQELDLEWEDAE